MAVRRIDLNERRSRVERRHRIAPTLRAATLDEAVDSVLCLHATDPSSVYLAAFARLDGLTVEHLDAALYDERSLVKHMAMRRTLWVLPRHLLGAAQVAASDKVAARERARLVKEVEEAGLFDDGAGWLAEASAQVLATLDDGMPRSSTQLRAELPILEGALTHGAGKSWEVTSPIGPRVLTVLSSAGQVLRATNDGGWNTSRPLWTSAAAWLGAPIERPDPDAALDAMVERWLRSFGPGTEQDVKWWLGSTLGAVRASLSRLAAVQVQLDDGATGWVLADDVEPEPEVEPWAALLPPLDPTTMGWYDRAWYLGEHKAQIFDSTGNGGPTIWVDGRIVGGWRQDDDGAVELQVLDDVGADALGAITVEAERLTEWLDGTRVMLRFPSPLWREGR